MQALAAAWTHDLGYDHHRFVISMSPRSPVLAMVVQAGGLAGAFATELVPRTVFPIEWSKVG